MPHLSDSEMYEALVRKDSSYEGLFYVGVKTTGIFCRPTCWARKPDRKNMEFFISLNDAVQRGYRPCKLCRPLFHADEFPDWLKTLFKKINTDSGFRLSDQAIRNHDIDPNRVRRWFKKTYGMTFQSYLRSIRLSHAFGRITEGSKILDAAFNGYQSLSGFADAFKKLTGVAPKESKSSDVIYAYQILTPLGPMIAASIKQGICLLEFKDRTMLPRELIQIQRQFQTRIVVGKNSYIKQVEKELQEYFAGTRKVFDVPLCYPGSKFQTAVWDALQRIPYGKTQSYKDQAKLVGKPNAIRAVARANGENRIAIIIPCHRVIGSDGSLTGYGGGIARKKFLLNLEQKNQT